MRSRWTVGLTCFYALVIFLHLVCAAPAEKETDTLRTSSAATSTYSESSALASHDSTSTSRAASRLPNGDVDSSATAAPHSTSKSTSSSHSLIIAPTASTTQHISGSTTHNHTITHPFAPHSPTSPAVQQSNRSSGQSVVAIVFEVLAGVGAVAVLLAVGRCCYSYRRTPPRDRIGALLNRHQLDREMEEMERERIERLNRALESRRWRPPPPPYQSAPAYETVVTSDPGSIDWGRPSIPANVHPPSP